VAGLRILGMKDFIAVIFLLGLVVCLLAPLGKSKNC
jgi:hypothetical protein